MKLSDHFTLNEFTYSDTARGAAPAGAALPRQSGGRPPYPGPGRYFFYCSASAAKGQGIMPALAQFSVFIKGTGKNGRLHGIFDRGRRGPSGRNREISTEEKQKNVDKAFLI